MPKRRNVMLGLGALAFGSGAITTMGAFSDNFSQPTTDFRVIADAQLRVRGARGASDNLIVADHNNAAGNFTGNRSPSNFNVTEGYSADYSTFRNDNLDNLISDPGKPSVLGAEIDEGNNNDLNVRLGVSNRVDDYIAPLLEINNNTDTKYEVYIHYAQNDGSGNIDTRDGYGNDVDKSGTDITTAGTGLVSRQLVQEVFKFKLDGDDYGTGRNDVGSLGDDSNASHDGDLISPNPGNTTSSNDPDQADTPVNLSGGESVFVKLHLNTDGGVHVSDITGKINSAAGAGGTGNPWTSNSDVDLLNSVFVEAVDPSA